jgi:hypothetical protein
LFKIKVQPHTTARKHGKNNLIIQVDLVRSLQRHWHNTLPGKVGLAMAGHDGASQAPNGKKKKGFDKFEYDVSRQSDR